MVVAQLRGDLVLVYYKSFQNFSCSADGLQKFCIVLIINGLYYLQIYVWKELTKPVEKLYLVGALERWSR